MQKKNVFVLKLLDDIKLTNPSVFFSIPQQYQYNNSRNVVTNVFWLKTLPKRARKIKEKSQEEFKAFIAKHL